MIKQVVREIKATAGIYEAPRRGVSGVLAEFSDPGALYHAADEVRKAGFKHFDVHSPFPIHGMDRAMGLGNSKVGFFALGGGLTGLAIGYLLQWWTGEIDYPLNISGKPFFAIEPSIPVIFELTILFAAFGAVAGMFLLNGLPRPYNPLFYSSHFERASDDAFFLHIAASDKRFEESAVASLLGKVGGYHIETIFDRGDADEV